MKGRSLALLSAILVVAVVLGIVWRGAGSGVSLRESYPSTYATGPGGYRALYLLAERFAEPARWERPLEELPDPATEPGRPPLLVYAAGTNDFDFTSGEVASLVAWVRGGGEILVLSDTGLPLLSRLRTSVRYARGAAPTNAPAGGSAAFPGVGTLTMRDAVYLAYRNREPLGLLSVDGRPVLASFAEGEGRFTVVPETWLFSNEGIDRADNVNLAYGLLAHRQILFDEYHHGHVSTAPGSLRAGSFIFLVGVQLALLLAVLFLSAGRRLGRPAPDPEPPGRTTMELVDSLAHVRRRARSSAAAARELRESFERSTRHRLGLSPTAPAATVGAALARRAGDETGFSALVDRLDRALGRERVSDRELLRLDRDTHAFVGRLPR